MDSFSTPRLRAERLTAAHWLDLRRMDEDEPFMALLGGVRDQYRDCARMRTHRSRSARAAIHVAVTRPINLASRRVLLKAGLVYDRDIVHAGVSHLLFRTGALS